MASGPWRGRPGLPPGFVLLWLKIGTAGCLVIGVLTFAGLGSFAWWVGSSWASCVPPNFPSYPGGVWYGGGLGPVGCGENLLTGDDAAQIVSFYDVQLPKKNWAVTAVDRSVSRIDFHNVRGSRVKGNIWVVDRGWPRVICIVFDRSSTASVSSFWVRSQVEAASRGGDVCSYLPPHSQ